VRIGIALGLFIESVEVRGHLCVDGGIVDLFPVVRSAIWTAFP